MPRISFSAALAVFALAGCGAVTDVLTSGCGGLDESRYYAGLDTSKAKGCWNLETGFTSDAVCMFDSVLVRYQVWNGRGMLQCSRYSFDGKSIQINSSRVRDWDLKTGAITYENNDGFHLFYEYTVVLGDTLVSFDRKSDPNTCSTMGVTLRGARKPSNTFKAQIQLCDSLGYGDF
jgi:hypothetical protein